MTSEFLGLRTLVYKVGDLQKGKEWYINAFGIQPYFDEVFYVGFNIGGYELGLLPEENPSKDKAEGAIAYWGVEDIQTVFTEMLKNGAVVHEEPLNVGGELMVASVKDPWGNVIGIIYNPHFKIL